MSALASPTASPTSTLTVHPLLLGEVEVDHTFLMWASQPGTRLWIPTTVYLILGAEAPILVDASFRDAAEFTAASGVPARRLPEQALEAQLARHGLEPGDIGYVLHTHLHHDHTGLDASLPEARILIQRAELQFDIPGVLSVSAGLFSVVFGFSHAQTTSWGNHTTLGFLVGGVLLLAAFAVIESRSSYPLLPLRVVTDRNRGASFLSIGIAGAAIFAVFLFLTYYLQQVRGYTPIRTGVAFLPIAAAVMLSAVIATNKLRPRLGPRPLAVTGMLLGGAGMLYLTRLSVDSSYATSILPALIVLGIGLGLVFSTSINSATLGVQPADAGVASATVSASQQIGGSLGTALLTTIAASAISNYITSAHTHPTRLLLTHAAVHGDTSAFAWAGAIIVVGAVLAAALFERGTTALRPDAAAAPATAH